MTFRNLMITKAVLTGGFAVLLLFLPNLFVEFLGASLEPGGQFLAQAFGAAGIGLFMLTWFSRNLAQHDAQRPILLFVFTDDVIGLVVCVLAVVAGVLNGWGWGIVATYLFFTLASGYLLTRQAEPAREQAALKS